QGNANYVLYQLYKANVAGTICASAASPASTCVFYDIPATPVGTTGANISVACQGGSANCSNTNAAANQFGALVVDPTAPTTTKPAFVTTANYDLATGLGSINVANLLTRWNTAVFTPSTVTLTCTSGGSVCPSTTTVTTTHGTSVAFNVAVSPNTANGA